MTLLTFALFAIVSAAPPPSPADPLKQEADAQDEALVQENFNFTHGISMKPGQGPSRLELIFPDEGERRIHFWMDAHDGSGAFTLVGPDQKPVAKVSGRSGEIDLTTNLPAGSYRAELTTEGAGIRVAVLGVKGAVSYACPMDAAKVTQIPAAPEAGFFWPYLLYVPANPTAGHLLVAPNNTGFESEDVALLRASASCQVRHDGAMAETLGTPLLVPLFPRPAGKPGAPNLYLHALTRAALTAKKPEWKRVDLQLLAMVKDAQRRLAEKGIHVDGRLLMIGFSASGSFVNRFPLIHPKDVLAVACVSPGGWPTAPIARLGNDMLPYPVGVADLRALTGETPSDAALERVRWFFLLGAQDENDAVPHRDSFSAADQALVFRRFGKTPVSRWKLAEKLYADAGLHARFALYPDVGHEVTDAMRADILRFFQDSLAAPQP